MRKVVLCGLLLWTSSLWVEAGSYPVWFHPANLSPDFLTLFKNPDSWSTARSQVTVFLFTGPQLDMVNPPSSNSYTDFVGVDAFRKVQSWGMSTAIETGAVKEWSCDGSRAADVANYYIQQVYSGGGSVQYLAMDEPLVAGTGSTCNETVDQTAKNTVSYVNQVMTDLKDLDPDLGIGDIEPYPSHSVGEIEDWINALIAKGFTPSFFHLDVDVYNVDSFLPRNGAKLDVTKDLQELHRFFGKKGIPFGVIFWPAFNVTSDYGYVVDTLDWVNRVHYALGKPDYAVFESWVNPDNMPTVYYDTDFAGNSLGIYPGYQAQKCSENSYCGNNTSPANLPADDGGTPSHANLIIDAMKILNSDSDMVAFNREYDPVTGLHHYTSDPGELTGDKNDGFKHEGYSGYIFKGPGADGDRIALYRLYNETTMDHFFTTSKSEADSMQTNNGYVLEGTAGYVFESPDDDNLALYRLNNNGTHFYTIDSNEYGSLAKLAGWVGEGVQCYMPMP